MEVMKVKAISNYTWNIIKINKIGSEIHSENGGSYP